MRSQSGREPIAICFSHPDIHFLEHIARSNIDIASVKNMFWAQASSRIHIQAECQLSWQEGVGAICTGRCFWQLLSSSIDCTPFNWHLPKPFLAAILIQSLNCFWPPTIMSIIKMLKVSLCYIWFSVQNWKQLLPAELGNCWQFYLLVDNPNPPHLFMAINRHLRE